MAQTLVHNTPIQSTPHELQGPIDMHVLYCECGHKRINLM